MPSNGKTCLWGRSRQFRNMADYTFTQYMAKVLYPEAFKDIDPVGNLNNYYKTYLPELKYDGTFMIHLNQK